MIKIEKLLQQRNRDYPYLDVSVGSFSYVHGMFQVLHDWYIISDFKAFSVEETKSLKIRLSFKILDSVES